MRALCQPHPAGPERPWQTDPRRCGRVSPRQECHRHAPPAPPCRARLPPHHPAAAAAARCWARCAGSSCPAGSGRPRGRCSRRAGPPAPGPWRGLQAQWQGRASGALIAATTLTLNPSREEPKRRAGCQLPVGPAQPLDCWLPLSRAGRKQEAAPTPDVSPRLSLPRGSLCFTDLLVRCGMEPAATPEALTVGTIFLGLSALTQARSSRKLECSLHWA